jgi:hypothetical protein
MCLYLNYNCRLDDALLTHRTSELVVAIVVPHLDERGLRPDAISLLGHMQR